ncbi:tRNA pseudouridine(55) synthase TruB [Thermanaerothrix sp.]|uniref:tRNA pseudouridine(55) synthase TruB n=1 Tax=Thermanaerothrix sp. TaxID=2972675 RepID=UPI003C7A9DCC
MNAKKASLTTAQVLEDALARLRPLLSPQEWHALLAELERPPVPAIRLNPLKAEPKDVYTWAGLYGWRLEPIPFCPMGWWVVEAATPISQTIEHRLGYYYIQEAASMLPVELFDFPAGSRPLVLDMAASPGGKTTHLIARTEDRGLVLANDSSRDRLTALRLVLQSWGAINVAVTGFPGEHWGGWYAETFDAVLLDAPCSMQSLRPLESHPMRPITPGEQQRLAQRQVALLLSGLRALKVGGQMVYATCTLAPEEDEGVLDLALRRYPGLFEIESVEDRLPAPAPALESVPGYTYHPQVKYAVRLWPHRFHTAGFFAARLRKLASFPVEEKQLPRPRRRESWRWMKAANVNQVAEAFREAYGLDLEAILEAHQAGLIRRDETLYAVPLAFERHFGDLPVLSLGLAVAEDSPEGWVPTHDWIARFGRFCTHGRVQLPSDRVATWLQGEDVPFVPSLPLPSNRVVLVTDERGRILGRGRVLRDRLKNLLPRRLVLQRTSFVV